MKEIEDEHGVEIIYAVESGSRAWGFESADSDWDVRFIYKHHLKWYLSVFPKRDVLEFPVDDLLDFSGWDIKKTLLLLSKSNPVLFEWLHSPIVYCKNEVIYNQLREAAELYFSPKSCIYHYLHMAKGNYREYLQTDIVRVKKYFYVLRPLLACLWVEKYNNAPPMNFEKLLVGLSIERELSDAMAELLEQKRRGFETSDAPRIGVLNDFIEAKIDYFSQNAAGFNPADKPSSEVLDELFCRVLM